MIPLSSNLEKNGTTSRYHALDKQHRVVGIARMCHLAGMDAPRQRLRIGPSE